MAHQAVTVTEALKYGWIPETKHSWIDLKIDDANMLRLTFPDEFPTTLKMCLQVLQGHVAEQRRKAGLPVVEHTYVQTVKRLEFLRDDVNQVALIRARFEDGASNDTPFEKTQIREAIVFLQNALVEFEKLSSSRPN